MKPKWSGLIKSIIFLLTGTVFLALVHLPTSISAQSNTWSDPLKLSFSHAWLETPSLTVDPSGMVHLVWVEEIEPGTPVILYTQQLAGNWSVPIDIIAADAGQEINKPTLLLDSRGYLHLVYGLNGVSYTNTYGQLASSIKNWQAPQVLVRAQNYLSKADFCIGPQDDLHVVYAIEIGSSSGIYHISSSDFGRSWQGPDIVFSNPSADRIIGQPQIAVDKQGKLHVIWVESNYPDTYPPLGIRYSSSMDGATWSESISLADGPYSDLEIVSHLDEIHIVWSGTDTDRFKFHIWSRDNGNHWSNIYRNKELGGLQGAPALVFDSAGLAHWLQVGTIFKFGTDALFENIFDNGIWTQGSMVYNGSIDGMNMGEVAAAVELGNELHVVTWIPVTEQANRWDGNIIYLHKTLDSPRIQPQILSLPTPTATLQLSPTATTTEAIKPTLLPGNQAEIPIKTYSANLLIAIGIIPVLLIIALVTAVRIFKRKL